MNATQKRPMREWKVTWAKCPAAYNDTHVLFVEAVDEKDAEDIVRDHIERKLGIGDWLKIVVAPPRAVPPGRILNQNPTIEH
jgi:hypothetical protein